MWTVQFRNQEIKPKRFKFPIRRGVAEGKAQPFDHFARLAPMDLNSPTLDGAEPSGAEQRSQGTVNVSDKLSQRCDGTLGNGTDSGECESWRILKP